MVVKFGLDLNQLPCFDVSTWPEIELAGGEPVRLAGIEKNDVLPSDQRPVEMDPTFAALQGRTGQTGSRGRQAMRCLWDISLAQEGGSRLATYLRALSSRRARSTRAFSLTAVEINAASNSVIWIK